MSQQTLNALAEGHALLQNGLLPRDVFDASCTELLGRLVNSSSVSWADRQQALVAAKQHGVCQQALLEAGQQLWQLKMESWRFATCSTEAGPPESQGQTSPSPNSKQQQHTPQPDGVQEDSGDSDPLSGFGDYGCDSGATTSQSGMDTDPGSITADVTEDSCGDWQHAGMRPMPGWPETDSDDYYDEAEEAKQDARAAADELSALSGGDGDTNAAGPQDQGSSGSSGATSGMRPKFDDGESDLDTDDAEDEAAVRAADKQAIKEIKHYQRTAHLLMSEFAFADVAQDVLQQQAGPDFSFDDEALLVLQRACESYLVDAFDTSVMCSAHTGRQKVTVKDMRLAGRLSQSWCNMPGSAGG